jgi:hypothetical protein
LLISSCKKEITEKKYVAKVNNVYLTRDELDSMYSSSSDIQYKNEIIRNWINQELLYQEAGKEGILKNNDFEKILDNSKRKLAASFVIRDFLKNIKFTFDQSDLENFYSKNPDEFKLAYRSYLLNSVTFSNEDDALKFRSAAVEKSWDDAALLIQKDSSIITKKSKDLLFEYQVQPISFLRVVKELYPSEISIVMNNEEGKFTVLQLLEKFNKGDIPPFDLIQDEVKSLYLTEKRELTVKEYIKQLYSKNDIEVKN